MACYEIGPSVKKHKCIISVLKEINIWCEFNLVPIAKLKTNTLVFYFKIYKPLA